MRAALTGRYAVERELGHGGMAIVFLAQDSKHHRSVAIKVLRPEIGAALGAERFLREIRIAAGLAHPHILPLYDSGEAGGLLYYVTPYIAGESLRDRLAREAQLPLESALEITHQVARALAYAHSHDVVHRDIKPENILLTGDEVVVADFGIARAITAAGGDRLTETVLAVGTPAYMSPEQALGEGTLDGRSDIYSLACVLYEMLAGEPPYTGPTAQAITARRLTDPVPPLRTVRASVPAEVERVIARALNKVPADRFATATQFGEALRHGETESVPTPSRRLSARLLGGVAVIVLAALLAAWWAMHRTPPALNANLLAVAPFEVHGASVHSWGEGLVEYLSRSLDGAGELQTVSPSVFLRRWSGRADPASARALGVRTGAGLVVFGSVVQGQRDSVRLRATLLDVASGRSEGEVEVRGDTLGIDHVADSLAVSLLRQLGRTRPVGAVRNAPFGAAALPAIKEFLQGERFYRRGQYDSALVYHARAVALDSTFALAYRRIALELGWAPSTSRKFKPASVYAFTAGALNRGLSARDSVLIAGDSLSYALYYEELPESTGFPLRARLHALLHDATRRFPDDPEIWQAAGEARVHLDPFASPADVLRFFDNAIALDSGFAPAYEHVLSLSLQSGDEQRARQYARAYLALNANDANSASIRLAALMLDAPPGGAAETARIIDTIGIITLWRAGLEHLGVWTDSAETAIRMLRALPIGVRSTAGADDWVGDSAMWPQFLAERLLYRGHAREAYRVYRHVIAHPPDPRWASFLDPFDNLALLGAIPADSVTVLIERSPRAEVLSSPRWLAWWFTVRDTVALARAVEHATRLVARSTGALERMHAEAQRSAAAGYLALARGDSGMAIRQLRAVPESTCTPVRCAFALEKLTLAQLLAARGDDREAGAIIDRWLWNVTGPFFVVARLERARIAERGGDRDTAIQGYQFVVDAWRHADAELQPYVADAREGLRRLGQEPHR